MNYTFAVLLISVSTAFAQNTLTISDAALQTMGTQACACLTRQIGSAGNSAADANECITGIVDKNVAELAALAGLTQRGAVGETRQQAQTQLTTYLKKACPAFTRTAALDSQQLMRADSLWRFGKNREALAVYQTVVGAMPVSSDQLLERGQARLLHEDFFGALADFQRVLERDSTHATALSYRGMAKNLLGDNGSSLADHDQAIILNPDQSVFYSNRAQLFDSAEKLEQAEGDYQRALKLDPNNVEANLHLATLYQTNKVYDKEVERLFNRAIDLMPSLSRAWNARGLYYTETQNITGAIADFKKAIDLDSSVAASYHNLANCYYQLEDYALALAYTDSALAVNAGDSEYEGLYLGFKSDVLLKLKKPAEAIPLINEAIRLEAGEAYHYDQRAAIYEALKKPKEAIADYTRSIELIGTDGSIYYKRGLLKFQLNNRAGACADYKKGKALGDEAAAKAARRYCK